MNNNYVSFLVQLKNYSILGRKGFSFKYNRKIIELVQFMYISGVIQHFYVLNDKIHVIIRYFLGVTPLSQLKWFGKRCFFNSLNFRHISRISFKSRIICISTDKGFLSAEQCKKYKKGGIILFIC